jgi:DnaJ-class molecular chaperone
MVKKKKPCPTCNGCGFYGEDDCEECDGSGEIINDK